METAALAALRMSTAVKKNKIFGFYQAKGKSCVVFQKQYVLPHEFHNKCCLILVTEAIYSYSNASSKQEMKLLKNEGQKPQVRIY
jgi:hypothetical protein